MTYDAHLSCSCTRRHRRVTNSGRKTSSLTFYDLVNNWIIDLTQILSILYPLPENSKCWHALSVCKDKCYLIVWLKSSTHRVWQRNNAYIAYSGNHLYMSSDPGDNLKNYLSRCPSIRNSHAYTWHTWPDLFLVIPSASALLQVLQQLRQTSP